MKIYFQRKPIYNCLCSWSLKTKGKECLHRNSLISFARLIWCPRFKRVYSYEYYSQSHGAFYSCTSVCARTHTHALTHTNTHTHTQTHITHVTHVTHAIKTTLRCSRSLSLNKKWWKKIRKARLFRNVYFHLRKRFCSGSWGKYRGTMLSRKRKDKNVRNNKTRRLCVYVPIIYSSS